VSLIHERRGQTDAVTPDRSVVKSGIDELLDQVRSSLVRLAPHEAFTAVSQGALLIDTRPEALRRADGSIPGAHVVERNVLEWRLDPTSPDRLTAINHHAQVVIIFCDEGYASSLAAASLQQLGLRNATDLDGGFQAWRRAGFPVDARGATDPVA
jgi:rhodanese-related sulfurtransferase